MAKGTIKQRIALEGGDEIKKELLELGRAGEVVWAKLNAQSKKLKPPTEFNKGIETLKRSFADLSRFSTQLGTSFGRVSKSWDDLGNAASRMTRRIGLISVAVTGAVTAFGLLIKRSADSADALTENAERAGLSVQAFQSLSAVAKLSGLSQQDLARGLLNLNKNLKEATGAAQSFVSQGLAPVKDAAARAKEQYGEAGVNVTRFGAALEKTEGAINDTTEALKTLGITNVEAFEKLSNEDKVIALADGVRNLNDETRAGVALNQLFGRSGLTWLPFLNQGGAKIKALVTELRALGFELNEAGVKQLAESSDRMAFLGLAADLLRQKLAAAFAPAIITGTNRLLKFLEENQVKIREFIDFLEKEVTIVIEDFIKILNGDRMNVTNPWILVWEQNLRKFGETIRFVVFDIALPAFEKLRIILEGVATAINSVFGTKLTGTELGIVLLVVQLTGVLGPLIGAVNLAITVIPLLVRAIAGLSGPLGLAVIGLAALTVEINKNWPTIQKGFDDFFSNQNEQKARTFWENIGRGAAVLVKAWTDAIADLKKLWEWLTTNTPKAAPELPDVSGTIGGGLARGGYVRGRGTSTSDSILARLSDGEFVIAAKAVRKYGPNLLRAINSMVLPKLPGFKTGGLVAAPTFKLGLPSFALGGLVDDLTAGFSPKIALPRMAMAGASSGRVPANIHFGGESYEVSATEDVLQRMGRAAVRQKMTSGGRKPGWYGS